MDQNQEVSVYRENERLRRELAAIKAGASNRDFVQVSRRHIDDLNALASASPTAHKLLWALCKSMNKQNAVVISLESLAKLSGKSVATVKRGISLLREQQWIETIKVGSGNVYRVNSRVFWQSRADGKWATFNAAVVVDWDEQDAKTKQLNDGATGLRQIPFVESGEEVSVLDAAASTEEPPTQPHLDL